MHTTEGLMERVEQLLNAGRTESQQRIAKYGFRADCECTWCGDDGMNREEGSICICPAGDRKAKSIARIASWPHIVPERFADYTLESCPNERLVAAIAQWMTEDPIRTGCNLVIQGKVGIGKTGSAIGALRGMHFAGATVGYWSLPNLMDVFRAEERSQKTGKDHLAGMKLPTMSILTRLDCLLLDDLGQERVTDYVAERLYVLIDGRYVARKPTILTTNLSGSDLANHIGERSASRLREKYIAVTGSGPDYRRQPAPKGSEAA